MTVDPNAVWAAMRSAAASIIDAAERGEAPSGDEAESLAADFEALDDWLAKGGFLPRDWRGTV